MFYIAFSKPWEEKMSVFPVKDKLELQIHAAKKGQIVNTSGFASHIQFLLWIHFVFVFMTLYKHGNHFLAQEPKKQSL